MKTKTLITLFSLLFLYYTGTSQNKPDSLAIKNACSNYIEGWKEGDINKISASVSPELVKRTVMVDREGNSYSSGMSFSLFKTFSRSSKDGIQLKDFLPGEDFSYEVIIYDISGDFASAKTIVPKYNFFDFCHLAKFDGEWKIFNIIWGWIPQEQAK
jgi:hypothetical protein